MITNQIVDEYMCEMYPGTPYKISQISDNIVMLVYYHIDDFGIQHTQSISINDMDILEFNRNKIIKSIGL